MIIVSKLVLGTVQFGINYGINNLKGKPNQEEVNQILLNAYKQGITTLDTAEAYGNAHQIIGLYHKKYPLSKFDIITKLPALKYESIIERVDSYLNDLNVIELAALLFHSFQAYYSNKDIINQLLHLKALGKIKKIGVSVYTNEEFRETICDKDIDIIQMPFNLLDNISQRGELMQEAKAKGKIIHTRSTFLQGLFFLPMDRINPAILSLKGDLALIRQIAEANNISIEKLALNYCLQQENIDSVLIGVDSLEHLMENVVNADFSVNNNIISYINKIKVSEPQLLNPSLWNR